MDERIKEPDRFGCAACWPDSAAVAWRAAGELVTRARLVDESHFIVSLRQCPACGQSFVSVFTEMIDWADGDDPQFRSLLPVTPEEAASLSATPDGEIESRLEAMAPRRRSLRWDFPKGVDQPRVSWGQGGRVGPHD